MSEKKDKKNEAINLEFDFTNPRRFSFNIVFNITRIFRRLISRSSFFKIGGDKNV